MNGPRAWHVVAAAAVMAAQGPGCASRPTGHARSSPAVVSPADATPHVSHEQWEFGGRPGKLIRTDSYRIFTTETDPVLLEQLPRFLELALDQYTTAYSPPPLPPLPRPKVRLDTFLMSQQDQWAMLTRQLMGDQAATYLKIDRGGFSSGGRAILRSIGRRDTLAIAAHEGWHQYTQRTFKQELPAWLEEGIAVSMEGFVPDPADPQHVIFRMWANTERYDQLARAAEAGQLRPLHDLVGTAPQSLINSSTSATLTYYAQLWALMRFLDEGEGGRHTKGVQAAVAAAAAGKLRDGVNSRLGRPSTPLSLGADVFAAYISDDFVAFESDYSEFVAVMLAPGARERIARGESTMVPTAGQ